MPRDGRDYLIKVNTGTVGVPVWTAIGYQSGSLSRDRSKDMIPLPNKVIKDKEYLGGERDETLALDLLYVPDDAGYAALETAYESDDPDTEKIQICESEDGTDLRWAYFLISNISEAKPRNEAATVSVTFQRSGGWTTL